MTRDEILSDIRTLEAYLRKHGVCFPTAVGDAAWTKIDKRFVVTYKGEVLANASSVNIRKGFELLPDLVKRLAWIASRTLKELRPSTSSPKHQPAPGTTTSAKSKTADSTLVVVRRPRSAAAP